MSADGRRTVPEEDGLIRMVGVGRVRLRTIGPSVWGTGHDVLSIAALSTSCRYRLQRHQWSLVSEPTVAPYLKQHVAGAIVAISSDASFTEGHCMPPSEHSLQRRPQVIFAKRDATWRKRVSLLRKWGRNGPALTSPTPFVLLLNHIKLRKYNTYVSFRNGAGAGPTPFPAGNGVGPEPTPFC